MPKKRGKKSSTANGGAPDGTRGRKGKKTQKSVRLTNFDEARNFLHGVALTPEAFYAKDENMSKSLLQCVKLYFDHDKKNAEESTSVIPGSELSELFVDGLDLEQVWEQINMQNIPIMKHYTKVFSNADALDEINLIKDGSGSDGDSSSNVDGTSGSSDSDENDSDSEDDSKSSSADEEVPYNDEGSNDVKDTRNKLQRSSSGEGDDVDHDLKERIKLNTEQEKFFNFEDFEKFADGNEDLGEIDDSVDIYESMYGEEQVGEEDGSSSEEEFEDGVDLEKEGSSIGTEIREKKNPRLTVQVQPEENKTIDNLTHDDFFGPTINPADNSKEVQHENEGTAVVAQEEKDTLQNESSSSSSTSNSDDDGSDSSSDSSDSDAEPAEARQLSRHEKYEMDKKAEIEALEQELLKTKSWDMLGETSSRKRPENSLLEKDLDYQRTIKVAPTITEDVTKTIEDMIKQRIRDELWDDVERKMEDKALKPGRELEEVSTEKSKLGLGDVYARDYEENVLGNASAKDIEKQKLHDEISGIWDELSSKLDAMSNYHFTPKPVVDDIQIKSNVASIQMEEVLPMGVSEASRLAPEEVYKKKRGREGVLVGEDELGTDERARKRRAKKAARRKARQARKADEKAIARINPGLGNKHAHKKMMETLASARNVTEGKTGSKVNYTKSSEFFNELTKDVSGMISSIAGKNEKRKKKVNGGTSSKLKL